jgi:hypothetical protein
MSNERALKPINVFKKNSNEKKYLFEGDLGMVTIISININGRNS